jgi:hypothetical protein
MLAYNKARLRFGVAVSLEPGLSRQQRTISAGWRKVEQTAGRAEMATSNGGSAIGLFLGIDIASEQPQTGLQ